MSNEVPFPFEGPTSSRFYFISGDHWIVRSDGDMIAGLQKKQYAWWHFALGVLLIPGLIASAGIVMYLFTEKQAAIWGGLAASLAAGLPMFYLYRTEMAQLDRTPRNTFVLRSDGTAEIQGETFHINSISDLAFEYRFYQSSGAQGDGGYCELDVVLADGPTERRFSLLSQASNLALKHTRQLQKLTGIQVRHGTITK